MKVRMVVGLVAAVLLGAGAVALGEEERGSDGGRPTVVPVNNPQYAAECGSCHMAYPPGLLPARSWQKVMGGLADHFGENAELAPDVAKVLSDYLVSNSADHATALRSERITRTLQPDQAPLRISELPFFAREHREIPARASTGNPKVKSMSNCNACHSRAAAGSFTEHEIRIPGFPRWED
jgi:hypothetical protein